MESYEHVESSGKAAKLWSQYRWYIAASTAIVAVVFSGTELQALDRFGETFTSKLCDILPVSSKSIDKPEEEEEEFNDAVVSMGEERTHNATYSKLNHVYVAGGRAYNALEAMEQRYSLMKDVCHRYADKMRGESIMQEKVPTSHQNFLFYPVKKFANCQMMGIGSKTVRSFFYTGEMGKPAGTSQESFVIQYPGIMKYIRNTIVVRHPLERLISVYRNTFEAHVQADQGKRQEAQYTFPQFIDIVLYGFSELSRFFEQNNLDLNTALDQMDTGMVDGEKGLSLRWNSYWKHCGVCHPDFQPEIIMHIEHLREDMKVIYDKWMEPKYWTEKEINHMKRFLNLKGWEIQSSKPLFLKHYYSQLTKSTIQALYEKYRADHELFGYTPDYFLALGKDN